MNDTQIKCIAVLLAVFAFLTGMYAAEEIRTSTDLPVHTETATTEPTTTTTAAPARGPFYPLTDAERDLVERVVMAEAGGEVYAGQMAVAQCILNACRLDRISPAQVVEEYKYTTDRPAPTASVKDAVAAVFDDGVEVFDSRVLYFYAPELCRSDWHETQDYVTTIGCHRFFREVKQ